MNGGTVLATVALVSLGWYGRALRDSLRRAGQLVDAITADPAGHCRTIPTTTVPLDGGR